MAEGVLDPCLIHLFASVVGYELVSFETSPLITSNEQMKTFIKQKLTQTYIDAGIRVSFLRRFSLKIRTIFPRMRKS